MQIQRQSSRHATLRIFVGFPAAAQNPTLSHVVIPTIGVNNRLNRLIFYFYEMLFTVCRTGLVFAFIVRVQKGFL